ncbi:hypothetical protein IGI39_000940 [Enterococcus sp. AZ135]|uniref:hypothetical protein n=1 Tax=unclassified Enterococcus TaxID=2608891 RepID=UPI003F273A39
MKISRRILILLLLLLFPTQAFAEEKAEDELCSGTYFPTVTITNQKKQTKLPLKVTITSKKGKINEKKQVGIDGRDFEYDKKENLLGLKKEALAEMAEVRFWSLEDGKALAIDTFEVKTLDNVESQITFYNFEKNVTKTVHAFKSGDEIHANKKYSHVSIQKYDNISGDTKERPWNIEYRTLFTYIIFMLTICPVILVLILIIFVYVQTKELNKIIYKKGIKKRFLWLLLPALFSFGGESQAKEFTLQDIHLTQEQATELEEAGQLEDYLIEKSGIQDQVKEIKTAAIQVDTKDLTAKLNQPREQVVEVYHSRTLIIGDYENHIVLAIVIYSALIVLPLFYFLNKRFKTT